LFIAREISFNSESMAFEETITKLIISIVIGVIIGGEREYRNKSAGLRTIILICLGSTIFTMLSDHLGDATGASRIAANVVTGIGFLGAGAIMREGLTISGMTTASTIWVAAALGIAVGSGEYLLAFSAMALVFIVLTLFGYLQKVFFQVLSKTVELRVVFDAANNKVDLIEAQMNLLHLRFSKKKEYRLESDSYYHYDVIGKENDVARLASFLNMNADVKSFEY
jgi:putative Mg2+ transporter-C (MgtC) family protein